MKQSYPNPLIEQRADPWIYRHYDGMYYCTVTVPQYDRIELRRAATIAALAEAQSAVVWRRHDSGPMSALIWAPEIHYLRGKWYIYFAAAHTEKAHPLHGTFQHRMYVLESDDPTGVWYEKGQLDSGMDSFCLDATAFEVDDRLYYVWAQKDPGIRGNSNIYIAEMETPWNLKSAPMLLSKPEFDWECSVIPVNEGPAALIHDGRVFLTYSANATGAEYCVGLLTASLDAPLLDAASWAKFSEPVFCSNADNCKFGPGHNSFTVAEDGETPLIVYHVRDTEQIAGDPLQNPDRHTCVQAFSFNESGVPVFGIPAKRNK
ncbi:family 43 glycosylhydrolase [Ruminococcaceae bacterium OttesenSCG-928-L11]|nr:family 43 glycosylhydrolase [Ruminococcaceae bacterium OttesenSCG-928-L11]